MRNLFYIDQEENMIWLACEFDPLRGEKQPSSNMFRSINTVLTIF